MARTGRDDRKKTTKIYRYKKKTGKILKRPSENEASNNDQAKIIVRNLSYETKEDEFRKLFETYGEIKEIKLLRRPNGSLVGCGFVQFKNLSDASKAIFHTNKTNFLGRNIVSEFAIPKSAYVKKIKEEEEIKQEEINQKNDQNIEESDEFQENVNKAADIDDICPTESNKNNLKKKAKLLSNKQLEELKKRRKDAKLKKRGRIIIRNLPFSMTADEITEEFSKYGPIEEVRYLRKPDGKPVGCCFIQFTCNHSAANAIQHENLKKLHGRSIVVDWALPKNVFQTQNTIKVEESDNEDHGVSNNLNNIHPQENREEEVEIKEEELSGDEDEDQKETQSSGDESEDEQKQVKHDILYSDEDISDQEKDSESEMDEDDDSNEIDKKEHDDEINDKQMTKDENKRKISNDVQEGRTVFVKNVPFSAKNANLKECMEQFGPVFYALICMDSLTEHSKGTAFVKFKNVEDADKCLAADRTIRLMDEVLEVHRALPREEVSDLKKNSNQRKKDSRNLYLVKEGVVLANSPAAAGVSAADMQKRLQLERWKTQILKNLNMFVSRVRLVVQNLPESLDDSKLRQILKKHSDPKAIITEARIMRDMKCLDSKGIGKSKGYAFVTFTTHEDALKTLRRINNNPNIISAAKRPIVAFSIENRVMINAKTRRLQKSKQNNPLWNKKDADSASKKPPGKFSKNVEAKPVKKAQKRPLATESQENPEYAGASSQPGKIQKMKSRYFLKTQAEMHQKNLKAEKKKTKLANQKKRFIKEAREIRSEKNSNKVKQVKNKKDTDQEHFNRLVTSYKSKLSNMVPQKSKWYET